MNQDITMCASTVCPNMHLCHRAKAKPKASQSYCDFYKPDQECESFWAIEKQEDVK